MTTPARGPGLRDIIDREDLLERARRAAGAGRFPQSLLLHGPEGVGKRTVALWAAALLHCGDEAPPCGRCRSCRLAARLEHPDIHLHFPMPRPKRASSRKKLRENIEAQREERLALLRESPDSPLGEDSVTGIYLAAIENIREQAARRPAMGKVAVFVIAEADLMVPQSASPEAANAFLKLLEEPPDFVYLILTTARPAALLPTIRSRATGVRVPPLPSARIARHLEEARGLTGERARALARRADGSVGRALAALESDEDETEAVAERLLGAALRGDPGARFRAAGEFSAGGARSVMVPALETLEERLRDLLCAAAGADGLIRDRDSAARLHPQRLPPVPSILEALDALSEAADGARQNLNPQSTVALLLSDMGRAFAGR